MSPNSSDEKKRPAPLVSTRARTSSSSSSDSENKPPRTPRFAEATTVYSPIEVSDESRSPFADPPALKTRSYMAQAQPSDVGFGYISENNASRHSQGIPVEMPLTPGSPLKSAMKVPGASKKVINNPLSPTFIEEAILEKQEGWTEQEQARDLVIKTRVRIAKFCLRSVNFSCSLIVLCMLSSTMRIFYSTHQLPARNSLPAWANGTKTWPQLVVLICSCISLTFCLGVFYGYFRGGHKRAEKAAVYYTLFAVGFFIFSIVMWGIAAGILQVTKSHSNNQDIWGWSCVDNKRRQMFQEEVNYALVCRMQNWSMICCLIEVIVESMTIIIYATIFYRYYSKRRLRKTMDIRDRARTDLYLAQLRTQTAPNTPGFGPLSPSYSQYMKSPRFPTKSYTPMVDIKERLDEEERIASGTRFVEAKPAEAKVQKPFTLQAPPIKIQNATPKTPQTGFAPMSPRQVSPPPARQMSPEPRQERRTEHAPVAPGEQIYGEVPIPGAYAPVSPGPQQQRFGNIGFAGLPGQALTSEQRLESPPGSPRMARAGLTR
ncbi:MAG: hypothetical protein M1818_000970 [Claussenomyces sp. TS43310]|nr:MAG: hypothetical protein M1818_000970 [Claussenomyces sp. TS43310]